MSTIESDEYRMCASSERSVEAERRFRTDEVVEVVEEGTYHGW